MRIAVDGRPLCHPYSGIGVYTFELLGRMADEHELFVYVDRPINDKLGFRAIFRTGSKGVFSRLVTTHLEFSRWARQDAADVFWGPRHNLPLALRGVPGVVTIHDMVWRRAPATMKPLNRLIDSILMPIALERASAVLAVSDSTAEQVRQFSGRPDIVVTPLAPRQSTVSAPFVHPRPFFLWVGNREPRKNLSGVVSAFNLAVQRGLTSHDLVLVGPRGWNQPHLAAEIAESGAADRIIDLGVVSDQLLDGIYRACAALVWPSFYEGFGIPLVEAMQYGKPVITSRSGATAEVAGNAGLLVDPHQSSAIAAALLRLAHDPATYQRLAANATQRSQSYSWDRTARKTVDTLAAAAGTATTTA